MGRRTCRFIVYLWPRNAPIPINNFLALFVLQPRPSQPLFPVQQVFACVQVDKITLVLARLFINFIDAIDSARRL
jgi:hypothetical protein